MRVLGVVTLALVAACQDDGRDREALMEADRAFARASQERRLDAWLEVFSDSGILMRPNAAVTPGKTFLRERLAASFADTTFSLNWEPIRADVSRSGDLGYTVGLYQSRRIDTGGAVQVGTGKYVTIWRRQRDGSWKVALDIGTPDVPR